GSCGLDGGGWRRAQRGACCPGAIVGGGRRSGGVWPRRHRSHPQGYHAALVRTNTLPRRLPILAGASALLLLSGCGVNDSGAPQTSPTPDPGGAAGGASPTTPASGNCASVKP